MAFNPNSILTVPYIGAPFTQDHRLCNPLPPGEKPQLVPLSFAWANYGVNQGNPDAAASIDLSSFGLQKFSAIRGCYIDNTGSDGSIFVYFPDTGFSVTCAPYSTSWSPVLTNGVACVVAGRGFGTDDPSTTRVFLLNVPVNPDESAEVNYVYPLWRASPQLSRGINTYSAGFGSPAIGDQWNYAKLVTAGMGAGSTRSATLFGSPYTQGGFITVTDLEILYWSANANVDAANIVTVSIRSNGASGIYWQADGYISGTANLDRFVLTSRHSLQHKLNAQETWTFNLDTNLAVGAGQGAQYFCNIGFSYQGPSSQASGVIDLLNTTIGYSARSLNPAGGTNGGFQFIAPANAQITNVAFLLHANLDVRSSYHVELWTNSGASPALQIGTDSASVSPLPAGGNVVNFSFPTPPVIVNGQTYWVVLVPDNAFCDTQWETYRAVDAYNAGRNSVIISIVAGTFAGVANEKWKTAINYTPF